MKRLFVFFMAAFYLSYSLAQTTTSTNDTKFQRAMSGIVNSAMASRGFIASDPRTYSTLGSINTVVSGVAGTAAAVTLGGITAPAWASILLAAGVGSVVSYAVNIGLNSLTSWLFGRDNTVTATNKGGAYIDPTTGIVSGGPYWLTNGLQGADPQALASQWYSTVGLSGLVGSGYVFAGCSFDAQLTRSTTTNPYYNRYICKALAPGGTAPSVTSFSTVLVDYNTSGASMSCSTGTFYSKTGSNCQSFQFVMPSTTVKGSVAQAVSAIPSADLAKQVSPELLASAANLLWQQAASQPGYQGVPYAQSNPITATDATSWMDANPTLAPTVSSLVAPQTGTGAFQLPATPTDSTPATTPTNPNGSQPALNLGTDPGVPAPTLEPTPTARQILAPLLALMPDLRSFRLPGHASQCPTPTFSVFHRQFTMDTHCTLIQNNAATIQATFVLVWALLALFLVLAA